MTGLFVIPVIFEMPATCVTFVRQSGDTKKRFKTDAYNRLT